MKIFVVLGSFGEYSDRVEYVVEARRSEDEAKARVIELDSACAVVGAELRAVKPFVEPGDWERYRAERNAISAKYPVEWARGHSMWNNDNPTFWYVETELKPGVQLELPL